MLGGLASGMRVLHAVIGLSKVHEGCKQRLLLESGPVNEVAQSKQLMLCGHTWPEARLARSSQASFLSPAYNAAVEDGSIQPAERLSHCNWPIVGGKDTTCKRSRLRDR